MQTSTACGGRDRQGARSGQAEESRRFKPQRIPSAGQALSSVGDERSSVAGDVPDEA